MEQLKFLTITHGSIKEQIDALYDSMNDTAKDFYNDEYRGYLSDAINEYADNAISVYTYDQIQYYNEHQSECDNAAYEMCILEGFDPKHDSISDLVARAGVAGWFSANERDLFDNEEEIKRAYTLRTAQNCGLEELTAANADYLESIAGDLDDFDDLDELHGINVFINGVLYNSYAVKYEDLRGLLEDEGLNLEANSLTIETCAQTYESIKDFEEANA